MDELQADLRAFWGKAAVSQDGNSDIYRVRVWAKSNGSTATYDSWRDTASITVR